MVRSAVMSKRMRLALSGAAVLIAAALLPGEAEARFGLRGGPLGVARYAVGHMIGLSRLRHSRMAVRGSRYRAAALRSQDPRQAARSSERQPANPYVMRAALTAQAALSGWRGGRRPQGWWRHPDGSYGWVGPVFWPFAHDDLTNAIILGDATSLSLYGYGDIYAAIFAPYARAELAAYTSQQSRRGRRVPSAESLCEASDGGGLPVDRIAAAVAPNEAQRAALDEFASAWSAAREAIRGACPAQPPATAADRLGLMRARIEAMIGALESVAPPLAVFTDMLDDGQKAKLEALGHDRRAALAALQRKAAGKDSNKDASKDANAAGACDPDADPRFDEKLQRQYEQLVQQQWPANDIAATLRLDDTGRARLDVLQDTALRTMQTLSACPSPPAATPQARLDAVKARLQAMLQAVNEVADALDDFEADLSAEQKAGFEAIGPKRGA